MEKKFNIYSKYNQRDNQERVINSLLKLRKEKIDKNLIEKRLLDFSYTNPNETSLKINENRFKYLSSEDRQIRYSTLFQLLQTNDNQNIIDCLYYINNDIFVRAPNHILKRMFVNLEFVNVIYNILLKNENIDIFILLLRCFIVLIHDYLDIRKQFVSKEFIINVFIKLNNYFNNDIRTIETTLQLIGTIFTNYKTDELSYLDLETKELIMELLIYTIKSNYFQNNDDIKLLSFCITNIILDIKLEDNDYNLLNIKNILPILVKFPIQYSRRKHYNTLFYDFQILLFLSKNKEIKPLLLKNNINDVIIQCFDYLFFNNSTTQDQKDFSIPLTENHFKIVNEIIENLIEFFIDKEELYIIYLKLIEKYRFQMRINVSEEDEDYNKNDAIYILRVIVSISLYSNDLIERFLKNENFLKYLFKFYTKSGEGFQIILKIIFNLFNIHLNNINDFPMFNQIEFYNIISKGFDFNKTNIKIETIKMLENLLEINLNKNIVDLVKLYKNSLIYDKISQSVMDQNEHLSRLSSELINYIDKNYINN